MRKPLSAHVRWFVFILSLGVATAMLPAQTLARPGWAGSGLNAESWWRNAVFYRITPATFQDSDGDGKGDLRGIIQRMVYLQSLGVDAVVLESPFDESGFDDLIGEASRHHIRLLVAVPAADGTGTVAEARSWLTRGCAGIWLRVPAKTDASGTAETIRELRTLTDSFPGQRVLVEDTAEDPAALAQPGAQLVTQPLVEGVSDRTDALSLRVQLAQLNNIPQGSAPLVLLHRNSEAPEADTAHHGALEKILASALFLSRGATALDAGQEIDNPTTIGDIRVMQWTPSNITRAQDAAAVPAANPQPRREDDYGAYVPYVAPKKPAACVAQDWNALPGFSTIAVSTFPRDKQESVARADADADSLLNFYRRLSQLHHENAAIRSGTIALLNRDSNNVLAWQKKPPANARTSSAVFVAANLGDTAAIISLAPEFTVPARSSASLLPVLSSSAKNIQVLQRPTTVSVAPWSVVVLSVDH